MSQTELKRIKDLSNIDSLDQVVSTVESIVNARKPSEILRSNMKKAGENTPPYMNNAHHIVHVVDDNPYGEAEKCRKILEDAGIDINSAVNGVFLPIYDLLGENQPINHSKIHTNNYYRNLYNELKKCRTKEGVNQKDVIEKLQLIKEKILTGKFGV